MPRLLDLFCCQGGAAAGYAAVGFEVAGVDIEPQPRYPYEFVQADALEYLTGHWRDFDAIHGSPPCQAFTRAQRIQGNVHPDLVEPLRDAVGAIGLPYVIENVPGAPLKDPVMLCGAMFGLRTYRHRLFETSFDLKPPDHPPHVARNAKMGRKLVDGEFMHVVGNFTGASAARDIMGMEWASRDGLREAIPPAYTEYIGSQLLEVL